LAVGIWAASSGATASWRWGERLVLGLNVEGLAAVMVVLVPAVALPVIAYTAATMAQDRALARLLALLLTFVGAMLVLVAAADLLTLLVAWELVGALSWALIAHDWRDGERPSLALHAFLATRTGDLGLVAAAALTLAVLGRADYDALGSLDGWAAHAVAAGLVVAAAAKSAQLPFSPWLFSAMAGPTPVSALLHSATMVAAGAYVLARTVPVLEGAAWLAGAVAGLGLATAVAGGVVASLQTDLKAALAASTSAQYGLILVAVGAGSTAAAGAHLVTHAVFKALLFLGAGVVLHAAGTLHLGHLRLGRALPFTAAAFAVGALALAGVPPLGAAWSKEEILAAAAHADAWLAVGVVVASVLSAVYAARLSLLTFGLGDRPADRDGGVGLSGYERGALGALATATVILGTLWLPGAGEVVEEATAGLLQAGAAWELPASLAAVAAGVGLVVMADRRRRLVDFGLPTRAQAGMADWFGLPTVARVVVVDPVLRLSGGLAAFDDRVVDAGVRAAARVPRALSRAFSWWGERSLDGVVQAVAGATLAAGRTSRRADERLVDRAVEDLARGTGLAGRQSRRLQTGLAHHYYVIAAIGVVALVVVAALGTS
jgi:NADH:ubiquinone oxidoreductase subunit 5 (subunit L)/multisubunit Na+/H+ antiporter MnhA subunit